MNNQHKIEQSYTDSDEDHPDGIIRLCENCTGDISVAVRRQRGQAVMHALARVLDTYDTNITDVSPAHSALTQVHDIISELVDDPQLWS